MYLQTHAYCVATNMLAMDTTLEPIPKIGTYSIHCLVMLTLVALTEEDTMSVPKVTPNLES